MLKSHLPFVSCLTHDSKGILFRRKMKLISLTQGKFAKVDDEDFEWLNQWKWYCKEGYACRNGRTENGNRCTVMMHRDILNTPNELDGDHKDGDKLNNQRYNLRSCTRGQNKRNSDKHLDSKSPYKGVFWIERLKKWQASITVNYKQKYLGVFLNAEDAARAYDAAAKEYHGEFAKTNF